MSAILEVNRLSKSFDGVRASHELSFVAEEHVVTSLIGPNGSGKTTVFNMVTGMIRPDHGRILFKGKDVTGAAPYRIAGMGLARTFQNVRLFPQITVLENMLLGARYQGGDGFWNAVLQSRWMKSEEKRNTERAIALLERVGLADGRGDLAMNLSHGQRRLLELARALGTDADVYLLDEPTAGVFPETREKIVGIIQELARAGKAVLFIEHRMDVVMHIAEKIIVLDRGVKIAEGLPKDVVNDIAVIEAYLGRGRVRGLVKR